MAGKRHKPEEIVAKLRQVDVRTSQGRSVAEAVRSIGVTEVTYYRWRQEYGGLKSDQVKRLKELRRKTRGFRKAVSDLTLEKLILKEAASGNWQAPLAAASALSAPWRRLGVSERFACRVLGQHRSTQRENAKKSDDDETAYKQPKRGRLWLNDGSCIRLRPKYPNHVWVLRLRRRSHSRWAKYRMLNFIDSSRGNAWRSA
jgi:putative transposase